MPNVLVTNNPSCLHRFRGRMQVIYNGTWSCVEVLCQVRVLLGQGLSLITHPLAGSLKPNQTPYRSVMLAPRGPASRSSGADLHLLELALERCVCCLRDRPLPGYSRRILQDFQTLDCSFLERTVARSGTGAAHWKKQAGGHFGTEGEEYRCD